MRGIDERGSGLSLGVGTVIGSPLELAQSYTALAYDGQVRPLHWQASSEGVEAAEAAEAMRVLPTGIGAEILASLASRERTRALHHEAAARGIAWKTGTSSGNRDGWCVALDRQHCLVLWLGNADGSGNEQISGQVAAEIALDLICSLAPADQGWARDNFISKRRNSKNHQPKPPTFATPSPTKISTKTALHLLHPLDGDIIHQRQSQQFRARGQGQLHWFLNGKHLGSTQAAELSIQRFTCNIPVGSHQLLVVDGAGNSQKIRFKIAAN